MRIRQVYQFEGLAIRVSDEEIASLFKAAPRRTFLGMRDYVGQISGSFRREWLRYVMGAIKGPRKEYLFRSFTYDVTPKQSEVPNPIDLGAIRARYVTTSAILLGLEKGGTYGPKSGSRYLAIPIPGGPAMSASGVKKKAYASPQVARASGIGADQLAGSAKAKTFFTFVNKQGKKFIAQLFSKGRGAGQRYWFELAWRLEPKITVRPVLRFISTWRAMEQDRALRLQLTKAKIVEGIRRDVRS